jgi:membrane-bound ClpP family serine protease
MGSVQAGLILFLLGLSLFLVRAFVIDSSSLLIVGVSAMAIGAGFLLSSAFSFRLSRSLGLINDRQVGR